MKFIIKPLLLLLFIMLLVACGQTGETTADVETSSAGEDAVVTENGNETEADEGEPMVDPDSVIASMSIHMTNNLLALGIKPAGSAIGGA